MEIYFFLVGLATATAYVLVKELFIERRRGKEASKKLQDLVAKSQKSLDDVESRLSQLPIYPQRTTRVGRNPDDDDDEGNGLAGVGAKPKK